jgi:hypothetical protein
MEAGDSDSDTEMADYGTDFSDDVDPKFQTLMPRHVTRVLAPIGNRIPPIPEFFAMNRGGNPRFLIWPGNRESPGDSRFGRESGIGVPIQRAGDFLVWARR